MAIKRWLQKQTLRSFDYQWRHLPTGDAMLSDPRFAANVEQIIATQLFCLAPAWFEGKHILDAGCGLGRWTLGLLKLGAEVTAIDHSPAALERTRAYIEQLAPTALDRLHVVRADLLALPPDLTAQAFDGVFAFGVLHHTGNTRQALHNICALVKPEGVIFLYLYGRHSLTMFQRFKLECKRILLAPFPFHIKERLLKTLFPIVHPGGAFSGRSGTVFSGPPQAALLVRNLSLMIPPE